MPEVLEKLDWASVIATVGAIIVGILAFLGQKSSERAAGNQSSQVETFTAAMESAQKAMASQLKTGTDTTHRLIDLLERALKDARKPTVAKQRTQRGRR